MFKYLLLICLCAWVSSIDDDMHAHVKKQFKVTDGHGNFSFGFDITNGIGADEAGDQKEVHGEYHYITEEGKSVKISYKADANGYHPQGDVIPTPPPTPEYVLRALEYIKLHPKVEKHNPDKKY